LLNQERSSIPSKMNHIAVDIIIPTYNRRDLLLEALKSVQDQTFSNWRCWIAEDGETKETLDTIKPFLEDGRFKYLPGKHAGFPAIPRNRAIRKGNAKYVSFLDDDDLWLPKTGKTDRISKQSCKVCIARMQCILLVRSREKEEKSLIFQEF